MRIVINAVAMQGRGGETYRLNILNSLCAVGGAHEFRIILAPRHRPLVKLFPPEAHAVVCDSVPQRAWRRAIWEQAVLPVLLWRLRVDLLFAAYNTAVVISPVPIVLLMHNFNPYSGLSIPWSPYGRARHAALRVLGRLSARVARTVVFEADKM